MALLRADPLRTGKSPTEGFSGPRNDLECLKTPLTGPLPRTRMNESPLLPPTATRPPCAQCGGPVRFARKYCSNLCIAKAQIAKESKRRCGRRKPADVVGERPCAECGKVFSMTSYSSKCCSDGCRVLALVKALDNPKRRVVLPQEVKS